MTRFLFLAAILTTALTACKPAATETTDIEAVKIEKGDTPATAEEAATEEVVSVKPGVVRLRLKTPTSEEFACIVPIQLENGLETSTNVTMIGFNITGPGKDTRGNMFAPKAEAGAITEARVIISGQSCDAFDTLTVPEVRCTSGEEDCSAKVEFVDGGGLRFARTG